MQQFEKVIDQEGRRVIREALEVWAMMKADPPVKHSMTMNEYQLLAQRTMNPSLNNDRTALHALHGMASEVGEIHGLFQKYYQGHEVDAEHLKKEVGDLLWMIAEFCTVNCWKMGDVAQMNIDKLKSRYPSGFEADKSLHRKEGDI